MYVIMSVSLNNQNVLVVNSLSLLTASGGLEDVRELITNSVSEVTGVPPATLNTIERVAAALKNDPDYFTTTQAMIDLKANKSSTYLKTEVDAALALKANTVSTYTKTEIDTLNAGFVAYADAGL